MQVDVLGAIRASHNGYLVDLGGRKQRQVLAALALYGGRPVSVDALIDLLWGDAPPPNAVPTLHVYVAGLRRALEPDRPARMPAKVLVTVTPGYALRLSAEAVDAARFDAAVTTAHGRLGAWPAATAGSVVNRPDLTAAELAEVLGELDAALALWQGTPYVDLDEVPAAVAERARLEELRMVAIEDHAAALLALGRHATLAAEPEALTAEHPLRERLWMLRVLALAGADRQADALEALRQVRRILADELGLDPGAALRELEGAILRQDSAIFWRPAPAPVTVTASPPPFRPVPARTHTRTRAHRRPGRGPRRRHRPAALAARRPRRGTRHAGGPARRGGAWDSAVRDAGGRAGHRENAVESGTGGPGAGAGFRGARGPVLGGRERAAARYGSATRC